MFQKFQNQKFPYISIVFGSIAFKLYDLDNSFEFPSTSSHNSLLEFWPIPPDLNRIGGSEPGF